VHKIMVFKNGIDQSTSARILCRSTQEADDSRGEDGKSCVMSCMSQVFWSIFELPLATCYVYEVYKACVPIVGPETVN
jgi:hypothetical protein